MPSQRKHFRPPRSKTSSHPLEEGDFDEEATIPKPSLAQELVALSVSPVGPPRSDEEKETFYLTLIRLKLARKTDEECAGLLGVSVRSIGNYKRDPYYNELMVQKESEFKAEAHLLVSELAFQSLSTMHRLMDGAKSEFVQYSAAKAIGDWLGLETPRETARQDARDEVANFLAQVQLRQPVVQVNIVNIPSSDGEDGKQTFMNGQEGKVVESVEPSPPSSSTPPPLALPVRHLPPIGPGGRLPEEFLKS